jgi:hypothetical protein
MTPKLEPQPMRGKASGLWFRRKGKRGLWQRYDLAAPYDRNDTYWYKQVGGGWHAFRNDQVTPAKPPKARS